MSIPIFTAQLKKARLATNQANARAAYAAAVADRLDANTTGAATTYHYNITTATVSKASGGTSISGQPNTWTVSTAPSALTNGTINNWYVAFSATDVVTYKYGS